MIHQTVLTSLFMILSLSLTDEAQSQPLVVVVHQDNPIESLTRSQVIDLFMGKYVVFPDGTQAQPADIEGDHALREEFYQALVGMPLARVNAYWSRVKFSGRARPPTKFKDEFSAIEFIQSSVNSIAYLREEDLPDNVKVVYRLNE